MKSHVRASRFFLIVAAIFLGTFLSWQLAESVAGKVSAGTYAVVIQTRQPLAPIPPIRMLTTMTKDRLILTTDETDLGFLPPAAQDILKSQCANAAGAPQPGERQSAGHGVWALKKGSLSFSVLSLRFDAQGQPIGTLRAQGAGLPTFNADGSISGDATLDYFDEATDPGSGKPGGSIPAAFTARRHAPPPPG